MGSIKCKDRCCLYADGDFVTCYNTNSLTARDFSIKASTQVLVVYASNHDFGLWVMLSLENGFHTDAAWKFNNGFAPGQWWTRDYDDSAWNNAAVNDGIAGLIESTLAVRISKAITAEATVIGIHNNYHVFRGKLHTIPGKYRDLVP